MCPESLPAVPLLCKCKHITGNEHVKTHFSWGNQGTPSPSWSAGFGVQLQEIGPAIWAEAAVLWHLRPLLPLNSPGALSSVIWLRKIAPGSTECEVRVVFLRRFISAAGFSYLPLYIWHCPYWGRGLILKWLKQSKVHPKNKYIYFYLFYYEDKPTTWWEKIGTWQGS